MFCDQYFYCSSERSNSTIQLDSSSNEKKSDATATLCHCAVKIKIFCFFFSLAKMWLNVPYTRSITVIDIEQIQSIHVYVAVPWFGSKLIYFTFSTNRNFLRKSKRNRSARCDIILHQPTNSGIMLFLTGKH